MSDTRNQAKKEKSILEGIFDDIVAKDNILLSLTKEQEDELADKSMLKEQFLAEYDDKKREFENKSKELLFEIGKFFFTEKIMTENKHIQYRLELESMTFSNLIFQIDIAQKAIFKLSEAIHMGNINSRLFEVLGNLQRVVLDISKFQHQYINAMMTSLKLMREDLNDSIGNGGGITDITIESSQKIIFSTRDRKTIIDEVRKLNEAGSYAIEPNTFASPNPKLRKDGEVYDAEILDEDKSSNLGGLESFN